MTALREAMRTRDGLAQAWFRMRAGDSEGARRDLVRLLAETPRDPDVLHLLGIAASAAGRQPQAIRSLRRSTRLRPNGWVGVHLTVLYLEAGQLERASRLVAELERTLAADVQVRRARAYVQVAQEDTEGALSTLSALEQARPSAEVAYQLAVLHLELGDAPSALAATRRAVERAPDEGSHRRALFELLEEQGDWAGLEQATSEAGAGAAGSGLAAYYRGVALLRLERNEEAVRFLSEVSAHGSPAPVALVGSAGHLLQLGAYAEAEQATRVALRERPLDPALHHLLGMVLSKQGRESEAVAHYRRAASERRDDANYRFDLLLSLCTLARSSEFEEALGQALRDFADDARFPALIDRCRSDSSS